MRRRRASRTRARSRARCRVPGLTIVSGLALGIDAGAHEGALEGDGSTLACIGTGPDRVYPASHRELAHAIALSGGIVSEFVPGTPPLRQNFPRRNRLISGLAKGVLVVEATLSSGSLITARLAGEQGRDVFAIPGSIHSPFSRGCHKLIRDGAKLVETAQDVLDELRLPGVAASHPPRRSDVRRERRSAVIAASRDRHRARRRSLRPRHADRAHAPCTGSADRRARRTRARRPGRSVARRSLATRGLSGVRRRTIAGVSARSRARPRARVGSLSSERILASVATAPVPSPARFDRPRRAGRRRTPCRRR